MKSRCCRLITMTQHTVLHRKCYVTAYIFNFQKKKSTIVKNKKNDASARCVLYAPTLSLLLMVYFFIFDSYFTYVRCSNAPPPPRVKMGYNLHCVTVLCNFIAVSPLPDTAVSTLYHCKITPLYHRISVS
jgi:hypothetical protein